jgi:hypothetical protein
MVLHRPVELAAFIGHVVGFGRRVWVRDGKTQAYFTPLTYSGWPKVLQAAMVPLPKPALNQRIRCWEEP